MEYNCNISRMNINSFQQLEKQTQMRQNKVSKKMNKIHNYRKSLSYYLNKYQERKTHLKMSINFNSQILGTSHQHKIMPKLLSFEKVDITQCDTEQKIVVDWEKHNFQKPIRENDFITLFCNEKTRFKKKDMINIRLSAASSPECKPKDQNQSHFAILPDKVAHAKFNRYKSRQFSSPITANHTIVHNYCLPNLPRTDIKSKRIYQSSIIRFQPWQTKRDIFNETIQKGFCKG